MTKGMGIYLNYLQIFLGRLQILCCFENEMKIAYAVMEINYNLKLKNVEKVLVLQTQVFTPPLPSSH